MSNHETKGIRWTAGATAALAGCILVAAPRLAAAWPGHDQGGFEHHEMSADDLSSKLGVDQATAEKIKGIVDAAKPKLQAARQSLKDVRRHLHDLLSANSPDRSAVLSQADQLGQLETALRKQRLEMMLDIQSLLTPEQRQKMVTMFRDRMQKRFGRHGSAGAQSGPSQSEESGSDAQGGK